MNNILVLGRSLHAPVVVVVVDGARSAHLDITQNNILSVINSKTTQHFFLIDSGTLTKEFRRRFRMLRFGKTENFLNKKIKTNKHFNSEKNTTVQNW